MNKMGHLAGTRIQSRARKQAGRLAISHPEILACFPTRSFTVAAPKGSTGSPADFVNNPGQERLAYITHTDPNSDIVLTQGMTYWFALIFRIRKHRR